MKNLKIHKNDWLISCKFVFESKGEWFNVTIKATTWTNEDCPEFISKCTLNKFETILIDHRYLLTNMLCGNVFLTNNKIHFFSRYSS